MFLPASGDMVERLPYTSKVVISAVEQIRYQFDHNGLHRAFPLPSLRSPLTWAKHSTHKLMQPERHHDTVIDMLLKSAYPVGTRTRAHKVGARSIMPATAYSNDHGSVEGVQRAVFAAVSQPWSLKSEASAAASLPPQHVARTLAAARRAR